MIQRPEVKFQITTVIMYGFMSFFKIYLGPNLNTKVDLHATNKKHGRTFYIATEPSDGTQNKIDRVPPPSEPSVFD